jgi:hypothetical protein
VGAFGVEQFARVEEREVSGGWIDVPGPVVEGLDPVVDDFADRWGLGALGFVFACGVEGDGG